MTYRYQYIQRFDGQEEIIISDDSLKLVLEGLDEMQPSLPITGDQWDAVIDYLNNLDIEIATMEENRIRPTREYDDLVGHAFMEFHGGDRHAFIDYDALNCRLAEMMKKLGVDGKYTMGIQKWLPQEPEPKVSKKGKRRPY